MPLRKWVCAVALLGGCTSQPQGPLRPAFTEYGPFANAPADVWGAVREVLAEQGYTFRKAVREEWSLESHWRQFGADSSHRYRVSCELEPDANGQTLLKLLVEAETRPDSDEEEWSYDGVDADLQDQIAYLTRKKLGDDSLRDLYEKTLRRLEEEERRKQERPK